MIETYIRLKRKSLDWGWYTAPHHFHLFTHLLLRANWNEGEFRGTKIKRGQMVTSLASLEQQTGISRQTIRTCLDHFQKTGEIRQKVTNKYRILTIVNFEKYQLDEEQLTSKQQTTNKQLTTIKEGNKEIKDISNDISKSGDVEEVFKVWSDFEVWAKDQGVPVSTLKVQSKSRCAAIKRCLDAVGSVQAIRNALSVASANPWWMTVENGRARITFDKFMQPAKVVEFWEAYDGD